ncbi:hypothetical protein ASG93_09355 [Paenibacillus sp. Soil787]|nr:hypothetical protein ASG93_09355 [Paenibacillus sp. Soil787]
MLAITRELNFSETTFIMSEEPINGGYDVRIFTPKEEVSFAGHPTLGTAYIIQQDIIGHPVHQIALNLKIGQIPVTFDEDNPSMAWMQQKPPVFGEIIDLDTIASVLGIPASGIDSRYPIQEVSTGLPALIVPLKSLKDVQCCKVNRDLYFQLIEPMAIWPDTWSSIAISAMNPSISALNKALKSCVLPFCIIEHLIRKTISQFKSAVKPYIQQKASGYKQNNNEDKQLRHPSRKSAFVKVDAKQKYKTYTFCPEN